MPLTIISGGQTGADRTALEVARELGIETGGWAPHRWRTDEGPDPSLADFGLQECSELSYRVRTRRNVRDAQATVWFGQVISPGARCTLQACRDYGRDVLCNPDAETLFGWLVEHQPAVLNVAGNRRRTNPGVVAQVRRVLTPALGRYVAWLKEPR